MNIDLINKQWVQLLLNLVYLIGLVVFVLLFYKKISNIFLTYYIIISSLILLLNKLIFWNHIKKDLLKKNIKKDRDFFLKIGICLSLYIVPAYCVIQEPYLISDRFVSTIIFVIAILITILGIFTDQWLYKKLNKINI